jgi:hypothetical protein
MTALEVAQNNKFERQNHQNFRKNSVPHSSLQNFNMDFFNLFFRSPLILQKIEWSLKARRCATTWHEK